MSNPSFRDKLSHAWGVSGLGPPPLQTYLTRYTPTEDPELWDPATGRFTDRGRQKTLEDFSCAIGTELYQVGKTNRRVGTTREDQVTQSVLNRLNTLNKSCKTRPLGSTCPFVKSVNDYYQPDDGSYNPGMSGGFTYANLRKAELIRVYRNLLVHDHDQVFHSETKSGSSAATAKQPGTGMEKKEWEPSRDDVHFGNQAVNAGMMAGKVGASFVSSVLSALASAKEQ